MGGELVRFAIKPDRPSASLHNEHAPFFYACRFQVSYFLTPGQSRISFLQIATLAPTESRPGRIGLKTKDESAGFEEKDVRQSSCSGLKVVENNGV
jgi:hypothetical protein